MGMVKKILAVDNDTAILLLYSDALSEEGYEVIPCQDGARLMDMIRNYRPDLIVMDVRPGHQNGLDLLRDIRRKHDTLPVALCTAYPVSKNDLQVMAPDYYATKSPSLKELKYSIEQVNNGEKWWGVSDHLALTH